MDMANYTIQNLRPYLQRNLVDYERTKFQEILEETPSKYHAVVKYFFKKQIFKDTLQKSVNCS